ncbi:MAG: hypothetical protein AB2693_28490 [Candidatus Thiodiazotropha sp.]
MYPNLRISRADNRRGQAGRLGHPHPSHSIQPNPYGPRKEGSPGQQGGDL